MKLNVERIDLWVAGVDDRPGELAVKFRGLATAGVSLSFGLGRAPDKPGKAAVSAVPIRGTKQTTAAKRLGFHKSKSICGVRAVGSDKPGLGLKVTEALAAGGILFRRHRSHLKVRKLT